VIIEQVNGVVSAITWPDITTAPEVGFDWNNDGTYTDETNYFIAARGTHRLVAPEQTIGGGGSGIVDQCTVTLHNGDGRFSSRNTGGALYADIAEGGAYQMPMRVDVTIDGTTTRLFTGYVRSMTEQARTPSQPATVTLDCRSRDDLLLQERVSVDRGTFQGLIGASEDLHIIQRLEHAGFVDGTDFRSEEYVAANGGTVTIDYGIHPILYAWTDDEPPLQEVWRIAGAAMGHFYCDPDGIFRYRNMAGLTDALAARQFGTSDAIALDQSNTAGLSLSYADGELYNRIEVEVKQRDPGTYEVQWSADRPPRVPGNGSLTVWALLPHPFAAEDAVVSATSRTSGGFDISADVTYDFAVFAQRIQIIATNANAQDAYLLNFQIVATLLETGDPLDVSAESVNAFWTGRAGRTRLIRGNDYIQTRAHAQSVADFLLARQETPRLLARVTGIHDPTVRVGRRVAISYPNNVTATAISAVVTDTDWVLGATGFILNARALDLGGMFPGEPYFVVGTNELGDGTDPEDAPLYW
jgi:hypothetical protein